MEKISVIMGIYNCADTLSESIDSIIAQTYENWELILCDDCSTDKTYEVAKTYADKYPEKIILLKNDVNSKLSFSLNRCLSAATGHYIARMDGDDISLPERFEKQVDFLKKNPDIDLVGTAMQRFDEKGRSDIFYLPEKPDKWTMKTKVPFAHASVMTYKRVYDRLGGYTVSKRTVRGQDHDLWIRFFYHGFRGDNIREPLYLFREDMNAIKRRTFRTRWNAFLTSCYATKMLGFSKSWLVYVFIKMIAKSLTPNWLIRSHRNFQKKRVNNFK